LWSNLRPLDALHQHDRYSIVRPLTVDDVLVTHGFSPTWTAPLHLHNRVFRAFSLVMGPLRFATTLTVIVAVFFFTVAHGIPHALTSTLPQCTSLPLWYVSLPSVMITAPTSSA
jgi:hypothetical protein